ncbi:gamma-glutamyltransferase [Gangjinia marincola]|uniref:Glutathione hydrolase proenzyme n=1 Tax=Gangjinia marincola TaxID=578463 RepID=A0ABN1MFU9_9FLAO
MKYFSVVLLCGVLLTTCKNPPQEQSHSKKKLGMVTDSAMVVSAREEASKIGTQIMQQGGNAFDAMFATEMALAVCYPFAGNLGGGGFMVYRLADGKTGALDYREKAPKAATRDMYLDKNGDVILNKSTLGGLAVGVPGTVAGIFAAHEKFGTVPIDQLLAPVIELAKKGYVVTKSQAQRFANIDSIVTAVNGKEILYGDHINVNDTVQNKALANTLSRVVQYGRSEFYKGKTADSLVAFLQRHGSIITKEDLAAYKAVWREPVKFTYDDLTIISMSPPSSGGITLAQIMRMIEPYALESYGHNSQKSIQVLTEAERRAYADRNYFLGDPDFVQIPTDTLLSQLYLKDRLSDFSFEQATPSSSITYGAIPGYESNETTHYSIVDQFGNAIAVTTTLNGAYGSKLYADELGFFLNNEMDDFSSKAGVPNMFGLIGAKANEIAPEKRMLSSMTPTIVEKEGKLWMTLGTPGGSTIITSVLQTILNVHEYDMTMQEAVDAPRFHHQWLPDVVLFEPESFEQAVLDSLKAKGYNVNQNQSPIIGKVDGIKVLPNGKLEGGADRRGDDAAVGF